ncbi:hypothetical protein HID58_014691 [Brassica napus]|uniref:(rape) hypothetical protein n=1 Tax=Brassica napus TaxID=3708 RepID=A0A817AJ14_BRANA|nr:hypothetical protein HID58_014691 [Brassica napus]CAF2270182.1 unnamed protein product [Brassica napus]
MTNSNPEKKEKKSKTSEEPTHRKPQSPPFSRESPRSTDRVFVGVSGLATDVQTLLEGWNDFFCSEDNRGGGYWWLEFSWCLDGHGAFHPNPSELGRLCSFEDVNSLCSLSSNALKALSRNEDIEK